MLLGVTLTCIFSHIPQLESNVPEPSGRVKSNSNHSPFYYNNIRKKRCQKLSHRHCPTGCPLVSLSTPHATTRCWILNNGMLYHSSCNVRISSFLGPVVQSIVSLTSSLRGISLTVLADSIYNIMIFFAEKMWVAFAMQKLLTFFQQKISANLHITRCKF